MVLITFAVITDEAVALGVAVATPEGVAYVVAVGTEEAAVVEQGVVTDQGAVVVTDVITDQGETVVATAAVPVMVTETVVAESSAADATEAKEATETSYKGKVFTMGNRRYQVISLDQNTSLRKTPGTRNSVIVIGELP